MKEAAATLQLESSYVYVTVFKNLNGTACSFVTCGGSCTPVKKLLIN